MNSSVDTDNGYRSKTVSYESHDDSYYNTIGKSEEISGQYNKHKSYVSCLTKET